jgi:hypothetical protein
MSAKTAPSICFISPFMGPLLRQDSARGTGGAERQFYLFGTELAKRGWRVVFIADCPEPCAGLPGNVEVLHVPFQHIGGQKSRMLVELPKLFLALRRARTRYYAIKTAPHLAAVVCAYRLLFGAELIMWGQTNTSFDRIVENEPGWLRQIRWRGLSTAALLIAQTRDQVERARRAFGLRAELVPNITLPPIGSVAHVEDQGYVFWCGNDQPNKRVEVYLKLATRLPERKFVMAMNGSLASRRYQEIKAAAQRIPNLEFLGSVASAEIDRWFRGAALYVNTSIREGFPNTYLQAFQQGCPVVAINIDPDGILESKGIGFCLDNTQAHLGRTPAELAGELAALVERVYSMSGQSHELSLACKEYIAKTHAPEVVIPLLEDVIAKKEGSHV